MRSNNDEATLQPANTTLDQDPWTSVFVDMCFPEGKQVEVCRVRTIRSTTVDAVRAKTDVAEGTKKRPLISAANDSVGGRQNQTGKPLSGSFSWFVVV